MIKNGVHIIAGIALLALVGCEDTSSSVQNQYQVSGVVFQSGVPAVDIVVSIDDDDALTISTEASGEFIFSGVPAGMHELKIYKSFSSLAKSQIGSSGDSYSVRTYDIEVTSDLNLDNLVLPTPVFLFEPEIDSTVVIKWTHSDAVDFREYKVYRHTSSGLDETTGTLVHVSTSQLDTSFSENTQELEADTYYYRVFVMNEYGRIGGSNITNFTLAETVLKVTVNYSGQYSVSAQYPIYVGVTSHPCYHECQDEGQLWSNNSSLEIDVPSWFAGGTVQSVYGPYYISSFLDISGNHPGSHLLPDNCPFTVYNGIDPLVAASQCHATPVYIPRGTTVEVIVEYDDTYLTDNYNPAG